MLSQLRISHFAIIDGLEVRFDRGFNVLTGETGAGKSILIDALHMLLGGRAQADLVRTGHDECVVEALFEPLDVPATNTRLESAGLPACEDGQLLVRRSIHREGRSRVWINGALATVGQLTLVTKRLVDVSSQHEHTSLLDAAGHVSLLDLYAGLQPQLAAYREAYDALAEAARALQSLQMNESERSRRIDYLRFQLDEIEKIDPKPGEEESLRQERQRLGSAEKLRTATQDAESTIYSRDGSVTELLGQTADQLERAAELDPTLKPLAEVVQQSLSQLSDVARDLDRYARGVDDDPARLEEIEGRLEDLRKLCRKHGGDLAQVIARRDAMRLELEQLSSHEARLGDAEAARQKAASRARELARGLTTARRKAARTFSEAVVGRLADLEMKRTIFEVRLSVAGAESEGALDDGTTEARLTPRGQDTIEFLLSPNPGEEPRALERIASGGELSRVMLAIKRVLAERDPVETYVFDEVDAGIGGATGEVVGRMIREVARDRQVLCITHLAQIAAHGETHFTVSKTVRDGRAQSGVSRLEDVESRRREVARMLSGHITDASLAHAAELLAREEVPTRASSARGPQRRTRPTA